TPKMRCSRIRADLLFMILVLAGPPAGRAEGDVKPGVSTPGKRGSDLEYRAEISLEEAAHGKNEHINVDAKVACDPCKGSGSKGDGHATTCAKCAGTGEVPLRLDVTVPSGIQSGYRLRLRGQGERGTGH